MSKVTKDQEKAVRDALATGRPLPSGASVNFGRPEPIQTTDKPSEDKKD